MKKTITALFLVAMLSACQTYSKHGCNVDVAATEIAITQAYATNYQLYSNGVIDKDTAKKALKIIDAANAAVNSADSLCKINDPRAADYLMKAADAINEFNSITGGK